MELGKLFLIGIVFVEMEMEAEAVELDYGVVELALLELFAVCIW